MSQAPAPYTGFDHQFIAGKWCKGTSARVLKNTNPYDGELLAELPLASQVDVDAAFAAAQSAQREWAALGPSARAEIMLRAVQIFDERKVEIMRWLTEEAGSTQIKAQIEWASARAILLESASFPHRVHGLIMPSDIPGGENRVYRRPLGVVGVISPWNFPLHLTFRSVAPALALGNSVVIKPASDTTITGGLLAAKIFEEAGLPSGVLSVTAGAGSEIGDYFVAHEVPKFISFTGSTEVGQALGSLALGGAHMKRVALELGGNSPFVVLDDADVEQAARAACFGRFLHQGQICMSVNRLIVDAKLYDRFTEAFVERVRNLVVGDPRDPKTNVGPLINAKQVEGVLHKIEKTKAQGGKLLAGGEPQGALLPPHVFGGVDGEWALAREESFAPIVPIIKARDEAHALELANKSIFGLSSAVFSGDIERGVRFAQQIDAGMSHVNDMSVGDEPHIPFGGEKNSGLGRFNGEWAIEEFTRTHLIAVQYTPRDYPF